MMAVLAGISTDQLRVGIEKFKGLAHRLELVRELDGVAYINDSKATNVDAGRWALEAMHRPVILLAGGHPKPGGFKDLRRIVSEKVKQLIVYGEAAQEIESDLGEVVTTTRLGTIEEALSYAHSLASEGDVVLLSPLCSSYDQFRDYIERGDRFRQLVQELK
jgi:UDP-N-acetylmuramoylalanine--D-glutamate ligase